MATFAPFRIGKRDTLFRATAWGIIKMIRVALAGGVAAVPRAKAIPVVGAAAVLGGVAVVTETLLIVGLPRGACWLALGMLCASWAPAWATPGTAWPTATVTVAWCGKLDFTTRGFESILSLSWDERFFIYINSFGAENTKIYFHFLSFFNNERVQVVKTPGGGGTHYVRVMGRLRGIDPPFSRHWKKILILDPPFSRCLRKISILDPPFLGF